LTKPIRKAIFPVAGLGTRFLPATKAVPKELLPVVDRPLIQYAVDEAREAGIEQMIFVTGRGKGAIEDYFDIARHLGRARYHRRRTLRHFAARRVHEGRTRQWLHEADGRRL
jgi:UTP--glucose-1-phosphate uridylyltransferase